MRGSVLLVQDFAASTTEDPEAASVTLTSGQHLGPMGGARLRASQGRAAPGHLDARRRARRSRGITVNTVNPGPTDTGWADAELPEPVRAQFPLGRWGQPADAARLIGWLCTDDAAWVTGQVIDSEGGFSPVATSDSARP